MPFPVSESSSSSNAAISSPAASSSVPVGSPAADQSPIATVTPFLNVRIVALAVGVGLLVGGGGYAVDHLVHNVNKLYASDLYTCVIGMLLSYALMVYEKRRRMILARRMEIAAEVNHHIRNALTAVVFSASVQNDPALHQVIDDATARINWVLTTVMPDGRDDLKWPVQAPSWRPRLWRGKASTPPATDRSSLRQGRL